MSAQMSWASSASRLGKFERAAARSCEESSSCELDLTPMRTASLSMVTAMACAVGVAGSCEAMKLASVCMCSVGLLRRASRQCASDWISPSHSCKGLLLSAF